MKSDAEATSYENLREKKPQDKSRASKQSRGFAEEYTKAPCLPGATIGARARAHAGHLVQRPISVHQPPRTWGRSVWPAAGTHICRQWFATTFKSSVDRVPLFGMTYPNVDHPRTCAFGTGQERRAERCAAPRRSSVGRRHHRQAGGRRDTRCRATCFIDHV